MSEYINTPSLRMAWSEAPWDSIVSGFPVLQITKLELCGPNASTYMHTFENARDHMGAGLVSCRLSHECLLESIFLEDHGFRFVEMLYQPELELTAAKITNDAELLAVSLALESDLPILLDIAGRAFSNERFHMDPRLDSEVGNQRYQNWVRSSLHHPSQQLNVVKDEDLIIGFFVTELLDDGTCYWHLNAIAPQMQGQGYGRRAWLTMLNQAADSGAKRVRSSIVARNHRVINLYARLGFRFLPPFMTFHWVNNG